MKLFAVQLNPNQRKKDLKYLHSKLESIKLEERVCCFLYY